MDTFWKMLAFVVFGPAVLILMIKLWLTVLAAVLPVLVLLAVIAGIAAGLAAALVLRRRLPPRNGGPALPPGGLPLDLYRVRRPRGRMWR